MEPTSGMLQESSYKQLLAKAASTKDYQELRVRIWNVFTRVDFLNSSFQTAQPQQGHHNINLPFLLAFYRDLASGATGDPTLVFQALEHLLKWMDSNEQYRQRMHRVLLVLVLNPQLMERPNWQYFSRLVRHFHALTEASRVQITKWMRELDYQRLYRLLYGTHSVLSYLVEVQHSNPQMCYTMEIVVYCRFMEILFRSNQMLARLNNRLFCNPQINHFYKPDDQYRLYIQGATNNSAPCFLYFPFLLSTDFKNQIIVHEADREQAKQAQNGLQNMFQGLFISLQAGMQPQMDVLGALFLNLQVRRNFILDDSVAGLAHLQRNLRNHLIVTFIGEPGRDGGGLKNEYFQLVVKEIFNPNRDMFVPRNESRFHWFNQFSFEQPQMFFVIGMILGLAIYNSTLLELKFPLIVYQKLLAHEKYEFESIDDLVQVEPDFHRSFSYILKTSEPLESMELTFQAESEHFGEIVKIPLVPGGDRIRVSQKNKHEYVRLYTKWLLNGSIEKQFSAFRKGFYRVAESSMLAKLFLPEELEEVICGSPLLDFKQLEKAAQYEGFHPSCGFIKAFWELLNTYDEPTKKAFLSFVTGTDRAPIGGLSRVKLTIQRQGADSDTLPSAQTCSSVLLIPEYSSRGKLKSKMDIALKHKQGFGMT